MSSGGVPEQRVAEALRARATGVGRPGPGGRQARSGGSSELSTRTALLVALLGGAVLGTALALLSLLVPGLLPPL